MIKFFRKIRKNLLSEDKTQKYLKYAFGEIILVVIGILIALQINNWNQKRIENNKEKLILTELIIDLEEQSKLLKDYINTESSFYQNGKDILIYFAKNQTFSNNDTIYAKLNSLASRRTFTPLNTTFEELISTGTIGVLKDKPTKRKIIQYYKELERISSVIANNNVNIIDGIYQPEVLKQTLFTLDEDDPELENMNKLIFDSESLNSIRNTSKDLLSDTNNTLHLFNLVEQRTIVAQTHVEIYKTIYLQTKDLLIDLKK